jgi:hypothetical protein
LNHPLLTTSFSFCVVKWCEHHEPLFWILLAQWREEPEEMRMWGCKRGRTARSSIRMCWYHMFSETGAEIFVLRSRSSPSCPTECVKMHCHVQREEPETAIIDGGFSCFWSVRTKVHVWYQECVRRHRCWMSTKNNMLSASAFLTSCLWGQKRPGESRLLCVFGTLFRCARTLPRMIAGLHLHTSTCSCMSKDRSGCSPRTVKPWRESLRIFCHAFIRKMYGLVLSTRLEHEVPCSYNCT